MKKLALITPDAAALKELHSTNLSRGHAMVPRVEGLVLEERCHLDLRCGAGSMSMDVIVRYLPDEDASEVGVEICDFDDALRERLARFVERQGSKKAVRHEDRTQSMAQKLKGLPVAKLIGMAKGGDYNERVALERMYGKSVWEALLRNPKITAPEVAKIARKGTVPRGILERIVANRAWVQNAAVRRALLANHKLGTEAVMGILRSTPMAELRLIPKQTAYSIQVRQQAKKLLKL